MKELQDPGFRSAIDEDPCNYISHQRRFLWIKRAEFMLVQMGHLIRISSHYPYFEKTRSQPWSWRVSDWVLQGELATCLRQIFPGLRKWGEKKIWIGISLSRRRTPYLIHFRRQHFNHGYDLFWTWPCDHYINHMLWEEQLGLSQHTFSSI